MLITVTSTTTCIRRTRLADALVKANKRFDMFVLPGVRHSFAPVSSYVNWLRGDYFARHLLGASATSVDIRRSTGTASRPAAAPLNFKLPNSKPQNVLEFGV